jgi:hypothetical protein
MNFINLFVLAILLPIGVYSQNPFNKLYGDSIRDEGFFKISIYNSNQFVTSRYTDIEGLGAMFLNEFGDSIHSYIEAVDGGWSAGYHDIGNNNFVTTGGYYITNLNRHDVLLQIVNTTSTISPLLKHYGGADNDWGNDMAILPDSGYMIVGTTQSYGAGASDVYIIRTDKNGDTLWTRTFGDANGQEAKGIEKQDDSLYIVAGLWGNINTNSTDPFAMKINLNGDTSDFHFYGNNLQNFGQSLCKTADGGYAIAGWSTVDYGGTYSPDGVIYKTDSNLNLQWTKYYGTIYNEDIFDIQNTYDNGFILVGYSQRPGQGEDVYIVRTDSIGDTIWTKTIGGAYDDRAYSVVQSPDSGFAIVGNTYSYGAGGSDAFFLKLKPNGDITVSIGIIPDLKNLGIKLYPNPTKENITIDFKNTLSQESELIIYNTLGQKIRSYHLQKQQSEINIGLYGIKPGVYYFELLTNHKTIGTGKFIKE